MCNSANACTTSAPSPATRIVKIGHSNAQEAEVLEGLKEGEAVIRHPANQIEESAKVKA